MFWAQFVSVLFKSPFPSQCGSFFLEAKTHLLVFNLTSFSVSSIILPGYVLVQPKILRLGLLYSLLSFPNHFVKLFTDQDTWLCMTGMTLVLERLEIWNKLLSFLGKTKFHKRLLTEAKTNNNDNIASLAWPRHSNQNRFQHQHSAVDWTRLCCSPNLLLWPKFPTQQLLLLSSKASCQLGHKVAVCHYPPLSFRQTRQK